MKAKKGGKPAKKEAPARPVLAEKLRQVAPPPRPFYQTSMREVMAQVQPRIKQAIKKAVAEMDAAPAKKLKAAKPGTKLSRQVGVKICRYLGGGCACEDKGYKTLCHGIELVAAEIVTMVKGG